MSKTNKKSSKKAVFFLFFFIKVPITVPFVQNLNSTLVPTQLGGVGTKKYTVYIPLAQCFVATFLGHPELLKPSNDQTVSISDTAKIKNK